MFLRDIGCDHFRAVTAVWGPCWGVPVLVGICSSALCSSDWWAGPPSEPGQRGGGRRLSADEHYWCNWRWGGWSPWSVDENTTKQRRQKSVLWFVSADEGTSSNKVCLWHTFQTMSEKCNLIPSSQCFPWKVRTSAATISPTLEVSVANRCFSVGLSLPVLVLMLCPTTSMKSCLQPPNVIRFL